MGVTRRDVLVGFGTVGAAALGLGCSSNAGLTASPDGGGDGGSGGADSGSGADGGGPADAADPFPDGARIDGGGAPDGGLDGSPADACTDDGGLAPDALLRGIDTFVVLCMENRSFDHYLGALRLIEGRRDIEGLSGTETNPAPSGSPVGVFRLEDFTPADPPHSWGAVHEQWNDGANDGFVRAHAGSSQNDVMGYHTRDQLPIIYALADQGAICQRWFSSVLGPTWPNRFYLHGATSRGQRGNAPNFGFESIFDRLRDAKVTAKNYYHDVAWALGGYVKTTDLAPIETFFQDAAAGTLPQFALIDPQFFGGGANDDHPDHDVRLGQALIASVYRALAASPQWGRCLLVITYDEHGGFYDHVPPPTVVDADPAFTTLGFRVPSVVVGPKVRRGCPIDTVLEHSSIPATLIRRFGLGPVGRSATTADLSSCLDPRWLDDPQPPVDLPPVPIMRSALARRLATPSESHEELAEALRARPLPRHLSHLDRRADGNAIAQRVLAWGEHLGAVRLVDD